MELRRIGPLSLAKLSGTLYAVFGLLIGAIFSSIALVAGSLSPQQAGGPFMAIFGVGAVIVLPLLYGGMGFVGSLIMAVLYNWLAGLVGGVRLELQQVAPPTHAAMS